MITLAILNLLYYSVMWVFILLPNVSLNSGVSTALHNAMAGFNAFRETLPFVNVVWDSFMWLLVFEVSMLIARFFLGSRTPIQNYTIK